jgi:hypothetical protein
VKVSFQLTMPNIGSWNGKWTGEAKKYYRIRSYRGKQHTDKINELLEGKQSRSFYYSFGDGWGANVKMEIVDAAEARKRTKKSAGFCGYEWMIDSIIKHGKIIVEKAIAT